MPVIAVTAVLALAACTSSSAGTSGASGTCAPAAVPTLTFAAYSTPREVYDAKIIPAFKATWKDKTGVEPQLAIRFLYLTSSRSGLAGAAEHP